MSLVMSAVEPHTTPLPPPAPIPAEPVVESNGKLRENGLAETDRHFAVAIHLSPFAGMMFPLLFLAPVVLWLIRKDQSRFVDDHGREMANVLINSVIVSVAAVLFSLPIVTLIITIPALVVWYVVIIISQIRGAFAASRGEYFRYPMVVRFLN